MTHKIRFTVSSRALNPTWNIYRKLKREFESLGFGKIENVVSVFGFVNEYSPLYGGRLFKPKLCLSYRQVNQLANHGIGMSLTLSNHNFTENAYNLTIPILKKLHKKGNSIIITNDKLALRIRRDFPLFELKSSVIKFQKTLDEINKDLELYDYVALAPKLNDQVELLQSIDRKEKVILFLNVSCLYNCEPEECFRALSDMMAEKVDKRRPWCSQIHNPAMRKLNRFDINDERFKGYSFFKISSLKTE